MRPVPSTLHAAPVGARGARRNRQPSSTSARSAFAWLQRRQHETTFSQPCSPPRLRGTTWSMLVAGAALLAAEIVQEAQRPDGVVNIVPGIGAAGAALVRADVNKDAFTGSTAVG